MKRFSSLLLLSSLALWGVDLTLNDAQVRFLKHNEDLLIAYQETQKNQSLLITAKERPNPFITASYEFLDIEKRWSDKARGSNAQATLILSHPIETAGKWERRVDVAHQTIQWGELTYEETKRQALISLYNAYFSLLQSQYDLQNSLDNASAYEQLIHIAHVKKEHGFLSALDYDKIVLLSTQYVKDIEADRMALKEAQELLGTFLALSSSNITATTPLTGEIVIPPLETVLPELSSRPDCRAAQQNLVVAQKTLELEKANATPNFTVGGEYASFGPTYEPLVGVNFSIPLPIYDRNEGDIERARITSLQASTAVDKALRVARSSLIQSYEGLKSRQRIYQNFQQGFISAQNLKEKQEKLFVLKGISVLELLDAQKSFREYQKSLTHALVDLHYQEKIFTLNRGIIPASLSQERPQ